MALRKIAYPKSLKDIPSWRKREITQNLLWFSKYSPSERLCFIDQEWEEIQTFIKKFGLRKDGTTSTSSIDDLIRLKKIRQPNVKDDQDIQYLLKAKQLLKKSR
jgi:hypothetical protein